MDLSDSFLSSSNPPSSPPECEASAAVTELQPDDKTLRVPIEKEQLIKA